MKIEAQAGEHIERYVSRAIKTIKEKEESVAFLEHNGISFSVARDSRVADIYIIWELKRQLLCLKRELGTLASED